jgi:hypothetical protein
MHEDETTDRCVEGTGQCRRGDVARDERHVARAGFRSSLGGESDALIVDLDSDHGTGHTNHVGREESHATGSAPDVQDTHPFAETGALEE